MEGIRGACSSPEGTKHFLSGKLYLLDVCKREREREKPIYSKIFLEHLLWPHPYAFPGVTRPAGQTGLLGLTAEWPLGWAVVVCV